MTVLYAIKSLLAPNRSGRASGAPRSPSLLFLLVHLVGTLCLGIALMIETWLVLASGRHESGRPDRAPQTLQIARPAAEDDNSEHHMLDRMSFQINGFARSITMGRERCMCGNQTMLDGATILARVSQIDPVLRAHADEAERERRLSRGARVRA